MALCRREPTEGLRRHALAGVHGDGIRDDSDADPDTTAAVATTIETTEKTITETTYETIKDTENMIADTTNKQMSETAPAGVRGDGIRDDSDANPDTTAAVATTIETTEETITETETTDDTTNDTEKTNADMTNDTEMTSEMTTETENVTEMTNETVDLKDEEVSGDATTITDCLPPTRCSVITSLEYFKHVFGVVMLTADLLQLKQTIARAPRPCHVRSSLTREDYLEMSAAWDEPVFTKFRQRQLYRKVHPMTVRNTSYYQLKRVRFGRDPSLKSDR